jgi:hypothetical protein
MSNSNPFAPPGALVADTADQAQLTSSRRQSLKTARRLLIASIVGFVACAVLRRTGPGGLQLLLGFVTLVAAITGIVKVCLATELGWGVTALALIGFFIPVLNIAVYAVLIVRATRELRSPRTAWYQADEAGQ